MLHHLWHTFRIVFGIEFWQPFEIPFFTTFGSIWAALEHFLDCYSKMVAERAQIYKPWRGTEPPFYEFFLTHVFCISFVSFFVDFDIMFGGMLMIFNGVLLKSGHKNHCVSALSDARF